ncbi:MAG: RimJ/RimL family protein N-acetyltransferase [Halocynthiibacter sp.]|jgi:RimJ/RimL family protein N-acetyltransferase
MSLTRIETDRLILRKPDARDTAAYVDFFSSERAKYIEVMRADDAWRAFATEIGHWEIRGWGMFTVCLKDAEDTPIGLVGPWFPAGWPEKEIGWMMYPNAEGHGFAYEAASATLQHAINDLGWESAVSYIDKNNARSIKLAERLGAKIDAQAQGPKQKNLQVYRHAAADWRDADGGMEAYS